MIEEERKDELLDHAENARYWCALIWFRMRCSNGLSASSAAVRARLSGMKSLEKSRS